MHRDLKPQNVLLLSREKPIVLKLTDFGMSRCLDQASQVQGSQACGTPRYMAPEQEKAGGQLTVKCDIYAWALLVAEMIMGVVPKREVRCMSRLPSTVPTELRELLDQCWREEPTTRPSSLDVVMQLHVLKARLSGRY